MTRPIDRSFASFPRRPWCAHALFAATALFGSGCLATYGESIPEYGEPTSALVILDLQRDFLEKDGRMPVAADQVVPMLAMIAELRDAAEERGMPVIAVRNVFSKWDVANLFRNGAGVEGRAGTELDLRGRLEGLPTFDKSASDAFTSEAFEAYLKEHRVNHVVVVGLFADGCVTYTSKGALNRGYRVTVVEGAVASRDESTRRSAIQNLKKEGAEVAHAVEAVAW